MNALSAVFFMLAALPAAAATTGAVGGPAACSPEAAKISSELIRDFSKGKDDGRYSCAKVDAAIARFPVTTLPDGSWRFKGEEEARKAAAAAGVTVSTALVPYGLVDGPDGKPVVVGSSLNRGWHVVALLQHPDASAAQAANAVEEGWGQFDQIGAAGAGWTDARGDEWTADAAATAGPYKSCGPCRGWLCGDKTVVCFADANGNGALEWHLKTHGADFSGDEAYEPRDGRAALKVLDAPEMKGRWDRKGDRWVYVGGVTCESAPALCGGDSGCSRPKVLAAGRDGVFRPDAALRDEYYPYSEKKAPKGCSLGGRKEALVRFGDTFVRFRAK